MSTYQPQTDLFCMNWWKLKCRHSNAVMTTALRQPERYVSVWYWSFFSTWLSATQTAVDYITLTSSAEMRAQLGQLRTRTSSLNLKRMKGNEEKDNEVTVMTTMMMMMMNGDWYLQPGNKPRTHLLEKRSENWAIWQCTVQKFFN